MAVAGADLMRLSHVAVCLFVTTSVSGLVAQDPEPPARPESREVVRLAREPDAPRRPFLLEAGDYTVREILDRASEHLRRSYAAGDEQALRQLEAQVPIRFPLHLDEIQLDRFVQRLLGHAQVFATPLTVEDGAGVFQLLSLVGSRAQEVLDSARFVPLEDVLARRDGYELVMTIVPVHSANAQQLGMDLRMFTQTSGGRMSSIVHGSGSAASILVQGPVSRVAEIVELARALDAVAEPARKEIDERLGELTERLATAEAELARLKSARAPAPADR